MPPAGRLRLFDYAAGRLRENVLGRPLRLRGNRQPSHSCGPTRPKECRQPPIVVLAPPLHTGWWWHWAQGTAATRGTLGRHRLRTARAFCTSLYQTVGGVCGPRSPAAVRRSRDEFVHTACRMRSPRRASGGTRNVPGARHGSLRRLNAQHVGPLVWRRSRRTRATPVVHRQRRAHFVGSALATNILTRAGVGSVPVRSSDSRRMNSFVSNTVMTGLTPASAIAAARGRRRPD